MNMCDDVMEDSAEDNTLQDEHEDSSEVLTKKLDLPLIKGPEMGASCSGRNCCIEMDFQNTIYQLYRGHRQFIDKMEREQEEVYKQMKRLHSDLRKLRRRSREERRQRFGLDSGREPKPQPPKGNGDAQSGEQPKDQETSNQELEKEPDMTNATLVALPAERRVKVTDDSLSKEVIGKQADRREVVTDPDDANQKSIADWLKLETPEQLEPDLVAATFKLPPVQSRKVRKIHRNDPISAFTLLKKMEQPSQGHIIALADKPKAYKWIAGNYGTRLSNRAKIRCLPGHLGAMSSLVLQQVKPPKPAIVRFPPPNSRAIYMLKKLADKERENLHQCVENSKIFMEKLNRADGITSLGKALDSLLGLVRSSVLEVPYPPNEKWKPI
ncbi:unnamed protein product [Dicrocoelium dendriticum]|nr:unnamed protein product [Dicrocoelium dendriticum]